jgi:hypothetical protein
VDFFFEKYCVYATLPKQFVQGAYYKANAVSNCLKESYGPGSKGMRASTVPFDQVPSFSK